MNMLTAEWKLEKAKKVWYEEGREEGREEGLKEIREEAARNALAKGISHDVIHDITGLDLEFKKKLSTTI
jgi:flagellar biosynthesis/type III secretory pathway protein FliH